MCNRPCAGNDGQRHPASLGGIVVTISSRYRRLFQIPPETVPSVTPHTNLDWIHVVTGPAPGGFRIGRLDGSYTLAGGTVTCVVSAPFVLEP